MTLEERVQELEQHIQTEHQQSTFASHFKEIIYGGVDGIITTFAVVAGFSGAALSSDVTMQLTSVTVLLFGLANLFADAVSMGLGSFLSIRSDQSLYAAIRKKEEKETREHGDVEAEETVTILMKKGFSEADAREITTLYRKNPSYWIDFMMNNELRIADARDERPVHSGLATSIAFMCFGVIPLIPFFVMETAHAESLFRVSTVGTVVALVLLGCFKAEIVGGNIVRSIIETVLVGGTAASVAFLVGTFFAG